MFILITGGTSSARAVFRKQRNLPDCVLAAVLDEFYPGAIAQPQALRERRVEWKLPNDLLLRWVTTVSCYAYPIEDQLVG